MNILDLDRYDGRAGGGPGGGSGDGAAGGGDNYRDGGMKRIFPLFILCQSDPIIGG